MSGAGRSNIADVEVLYQTQTAKAVCVKEEEGGKDIWLPLSQCEVGEAHGQPLVRGVVCIITAEQWFLEERGLV
jgi:hypothetical protein